MQHTLSRLMLVALKSKDDAESILDRISQFLAERGMKISEKKPQLTATTDGFDFKAFRKKVKHIVIQNGAFKVFNKETKQNRHTSKNLLDKAFPSVPHSKNKHVNVKGEKSPFDGDITYWSERNSKLYFGETSIALKRQNHACGYYGLKMLSDEKVHLHHADGNHNKTPNNEYLRSMPLNSNLLIMVAFFPKAVLKVLPGFDPCPGSPLVLKPNLRLQLNG